LNDSRADAGGASNRIDPADRLDSWKKIASYLKRDVSTAQRWERREGMPVHRHLHDKLGSVFAYQSELDAWWQSRRSGLAPGDASEPAQAARGFVPGGWTAAAGFRFRRLWPLVTAALGLLAVAAIWTTVQSGYWWRDPLASARFTRLTDFGGSEQAAAISPDGRFIAFLSDRDGEMDAWDTQVGSGTYQNLTRGTLSELVNSSIRTLGFSADSSLVSVWTRRSDGSHPGDVNVLAAPVGGGTLRPYLADAAEFEWSRDGRRLVYHTTAPGDPLFVRAAGEQGPGRQIYAARAGVHCHFPIWSTDDAFIYFVSGVPPDDWDIWRIRPSGAGLERITTHRSRVAYPVMLDRRTLLYLAAAPDGTGPSLYTIDVERRVPHRLTLGMDSYTSLSASADGSRLVATAADLRTSVWSIEVGADTGATPAPKPTLVAASGSSPRLGPDFVLFVASRGARQGLWVLQNHATREVWSSATARVIGAPAVAPDGRRIAFVTEEGGKTRLYVIGVDGSDLRVVGDSLSLRGSPAWTADGRSLLAAVVREGEPRLTRISLSGEPAAQLLSEYSLDPVRSPGGQYLVYSGADVGTTFPLRAAATDGRPYPLPALLLTRGARRVAFLKDQHTLVVLRGDIGHKDFWLVDLQSGAERELVRLPRDFNTREFDVSADGTRILLDRVQESSELTLIERSR